MRKLIKDLESRILAEPDINQALEISRLYGSLLWFADVGVYDAPAIESHLISRCVDCFDRGEVNIPVDRASFAHVITEPLMTGGHTRLMEKLAMMHDEPIDLIISRSASERAEQHVSSFFSNTLKVSSVNPLDIVVELVHMLSAYKKIVLHLHPDDIFSVVACGVAKRLFSTKIYFVNHADHVFSYGTSVADYYFELSSYGRRLDSKKTIAGKKTFLGIPVKNYDKPVASDFKPGKSEKILFVSAGSDIKYKAKKGCDIFQLVSSILEYYPSSNFLIIGSNLKTSFWWWPLKIKYRARLEVRAHLDYDEYSKIVKNADYYVDSHPIPGGTAFAEQYLSGARCVGLISPIQGYSPADKLKRNSISEVLSSIAEYKYSSEIFNQIVDVNGIENVRFRYLKCVLDDVVCENLLDISNDWSGDTGFFKVNTDRADVDVSAASLVSLYKLNSRLALQLLKGLTIQKQIKLCAKVVAYFYTTRKKQGSR